MHALQLVHFIHWSDFSKYLNWTLKFKRFCRFLQNQRRGIGELVLKDQHQLVLKYQQAIPLELDGMPLLLRLIGKKKFRNVRWSCLFTAQQDKYWTLCLMPKIKKLTYWPVLCLVCPPRVAAWPVVDPLTSLPPATTRYEAQNILMCNSVGWL